MANHAMRIEINRRKTIPKGLTSFFISDIYSWAGWYHPQNSVYLDELTTYCCGLSLRNWGSNDHPMWAHGKYGSSDCPVLKDLKEHDADRWRRVNKAVSLNFSRSTIARGNILVDFSIGCPSGSFLIKFVITHSQQEAYLVLV